MKKNIIAVIALIGLVLWGIYILWKRQRYDGF